MSLMEKIKVGDILAHPVWEPDRYRVEDIREGAFKLQNIVVYWEDWVPLNSLPNDILINGEVAEEYDPNKTAIERKIAFMRKRFEERKNGSSQNW